jgi:hypothetical protein
MRATLYPYATQQLLTPESTSEPRIEPTLYVDHTHGSPGTPEKIGGYFDHDDVVTESHVSFANDGRVVQFQLLDRQADAQAAANDRAISGETQDDGIRDKPLTPEQIEAKALFIAWLSLEWEIPLARCTRAEGDGVGHHSAFPSWNPNRHRCPGPVRERQLYELVLPAAIHLRNTHLGLEDDMPKGTDIVDALTTPKDDGVWLLQRDGGVLTRGKAPMFGSYPGLPASQRQGTRAFVAIEALGAGYRLVADDGSVYRFAAR